MKLMRSPSLLFWRLPAFLVTPTIFVGILIYFYNANSSSWLAFLRILIGFLFLLSVLIIFAYKRIHVMRQLKAAAWGVFAFFAVMGAIYFTKIAIAYYTPVNYIDDPYVEAPTAELCGSSPLNGINPACPPL